MLLGQCSNIFKIMPIILLVFVNYAHVSKTTTTTTNKKTKIVLLLFALNLVERPQ